MGDDRQAAAPGGPVNLLTHPIVPHVDNVEGLHVGIVLHHIYHLGEVAIPEQGGHAAVHHGETGVGGGKLLGEAAHPSGKAGGVGAVGGGDAHLPLTAGAQGGQACRHPAGVDVVAAHIGQVGGEILVQVEEHGGDALGVHALDKGHKGRGPQGEGGDAVGVALLNVVEDLLQIGGVQLADEEEIHRHAELPQLSGLVPGGVEDVQVEHELRPVEDEKGQMEPALFDSQHLTGHVGPVAHLLDEGTHSGLGLRVDAGPIVEHPVHRTPGDPGALGNVLYGDHNRDLPLRFSGLLGLRENDLVDEEENNHRDTAVEHHGTDVVDEVGHEHTGDSYPHAVDGVDDAVDDDEGHDVPGDLPGQVALAAEDEVALDGEVDDLADGHGDHVGAEVAQAAVGGVIAEDVPLEGLAEEGNRDAGPAEIHVGQALEGQGQELEDEVLEHCHQVADDDEQSALTNPLGGLGVVSGEMIPPAHQAGLRLFGSHISFLLSHCRPEPEPGRWLS